MSEYTVVVRARRWQGPPGGLSRALAPVLNVSAEAAEAMLARGPVTVDADLTEAEARAIVKRLVAMGLPAEAMLEQEVLAAMREDRAAAPLNIPKPAPQAAARPVSLFEESEAEAAPGGWGDIFPELDAAPPRPAQHTPAPVRPVLHTPAQPQQGPISELLDGDDMDALIGALDFGAEPAMAPVAATSFGAEPAQQAPARRVESLWEAEPPLEVIAPPATPRAPAVQAPTAPSAPPAQPRSEGPKARTGPIEEVKRPATGGFDGVRISEAVAGAREDSPPYAPQGYDDSAPHLPALATLLSVLAPGAGQIYNGQGERAMDHGLWFFMIKPWIDGVRQAKRQATRIATYWAPRPPAGALFAALKYAVCWYAAVGIVVGVSGWMISKGVERMTREEVPLAASPDDIARAFEDARQDALAARIKGLDAAMESAATTRGPPIADERERAERLYLIGLQYCRATQLALCEATMRRVTQLQPNHRDAFRLQAWASLRVKGGEPLPMPPVATKETLSEYELRQISSDMELPMPDPVPEPKPAPEAAPATPDMAAPTP